MVTPDGEVLDLANVDVELSSELRGSSVVVKSGHGGEGSLGEILGIVSSDEGVGVGRVTDDNNLDASLGVVVDGLTLLNEDLGVVLKEITSFHSGTSGLSTDQEGIIDILESGGHAVSADDSGKEGESTIDKFHRDTLKSFLALGDIDEVEDNWLVLSADITVGNSEDGSVTNVTSSTSDSDSNGGFAV